MPEASICLKPVNDLLRETFYVPDYQRGYRWTDRQVTDLLEDLWQFLVEDKDGPRDTFYCLQPIVVKRREDRQWELVDGQQRLTTLYILLTLHSEMIKLLGRARFTLTFQTRDTSAGFLEAIDLSRRSENIDFHHICAAYETMRAWFDPSLRDPVDTLTFLQRLLQVTDRNVRVIWYELPDDADAIDAFTRLNVGKIALTNSELVRALFLRAGNFANGSGKATQLRIALEWDAIEHALQGAAFWYFLHSGIDAPAARIEYLFELMVEEAEGVSGLDDDHRIFHFFAARFAGGTDVEVEWTKVKKYFMTLQEWFDDPTLYHLVGFLVSIGASTVPLRALSKSSSKQQFRTHLKDRIYTTIVDAKAPRAVAEIGTAIAEMVDGLDYENNAPKIRNVLLLFNIATLLRNKTSSMLFPFASFKTEAWDIEHIRSLADAKLIEHEHRRSWLSNACDFFTEQGLHPELVAEARVLIDSEQIRAHQFDPLYKQFRAQFKEDDEFSEHGIGNLTLLDAATNRGYGNATFPVKRRTVLKRDQSGTFVPIGTRNVFLKAYGRKASDLMFWSEQDQSSYRDAVVDALVNFFEADLETV